MGHNLCVERTGTSRSGDSQCGRQRRLVPAAHARRYLVALARQRPLTLATFDEPLAATFPAKTGSVTLAQ